MLKVPLTPGRRVFPNVIPKKVPDVDTRVSYNAECNAPILDAAAAVIVRQHRERISLFASFRLTSHKPLPEQRKLC